MSPVEELLKNDIRLPSPPAIAVRIVDLIKGEDYSFKQLAAIIETDPALVARIMRLANSAFYGGPKVVSNIDKAIGVLGVNALKNIALSFVLSDAFKGQRGERFDFDHFSRRSMTAAVASQLISAEIGFKSDEIFITSLLQDIGVAAMFLCSRQDYLAVLDERLVSQQPLIAIEKQTFGFDHQEVGAELLKMWGVPESVYLPIRYHHQTAGVPRQFEKLCSVIQVSDRLAAIYYGSSAIKNVRAVKDMLSRTFDLQEAQSDALIDSVAQKSRDLLSKLDIPPGGIRPFSQILQEANEELSRLNFSYEMLVVAHKEAKERAELLATQLKAANIKLRALAFKDDLTGLYNYRHFNEAITRELARCERYQRPLSLVLLDVDQFKRINDTYGHPGGDLVLQTIATEIRKTTRHVDVVTRYAGDEFALILPETNQRGALVKAENCRAIVEAAQIVINGAVVRVTISLGVATLEGGKPVDKEELMAAADRALYQSKQNGRNRVTASI